MKDLMQKRNVVMALVLCLPLIAIHYLEWLDLGYFVYVPIITLAVIVLSALASKKSNGSGSTNG